MTLSFAAEGVGLAGKGGVLDGRVAIITGGAKGIGRAAAERFVAEGARVAVSYLTSRKEATSLVRRSRKKVMAVQANVSDEDDVLELVRATVDAFGRLDVLVNAASYSSRKAWKQPFERLDWTEVQATLDIDVKGTWLCTQAAVPHLRRRGGSVVNFASSAALGGDETTLLYAPAKTAIVGLTRGLARALAPKIRVNAIAPGSVLGGTWLDAWKLSKADLREMAGESALHRMADPDEVARAVLFLASDASSFVTGQTLIVDGGVTMA